MPAVSGPQYRAMQAAAHGHSTLGIPQSVGKEFVAAGPPGRATKAKRATTAKHRGRGPISRAMTSK
jgi:hypothetical protein